MRKHDDKEASTSKSNTQNRRNKRKQDRPVRDIKYYQRTTHKLVPRAPFGRLVKEIFGQFGEFRITAEALNALQECSEIYLIQLFDDAYRCTAHRGRLTLSVIDVHLVRYIRGLGDVGNSI